MTTQEWEPFGVLIVCTGNICRSPAVERLLNAKLDDGVYVRSAGTHAMVGYPVSEPMVPLLTAAGADAAGFASTQLTEGAIREADLILTLTREHRAAVVDLWPGAVRRTFTLREYARALTLADASGVPADATQGERLAALTPVAAAMRGQGRPHDPADDDVVDPYRRSTEIYRQSFDQMLPAVETIVRIAKGEPGA